MTRGPLNRLFESQGPAGAAPGGDRAGFTLIEVLVAAAISLTFLSALYTTFTSVQRTWKVAEARLEAIRNGRTALLTFTDELKAISRSGADFLLIGINESAGFGNAIDDDGDGRTDEEVVDGLDNDSDWDGSVDDLHAEIPGSGSAEAIYDRFTFTVQGRFAGLYGTDGADLGDIHVDEDAVFGLDTLEFRFFPTTAARGLLHRTIRYTIGTFDGQPNVLLRIATTEFESAPAIVAIAPLAFRVLGLDFLYWDANADPNPSRLRGARPYWVERWNSNAVATFDPPRLPLPASIFARVTLYADPRPFETYVPGSRVETIYMQTVVNIEDTIGDALYPRPSI